MSRTLGQGGLKFRHRTRLPIALLALAIFTLALPAHALATGPCGPPVVNPVACENTLPGDPPSDWGGPMATDDPSILGFATSMSVNVGQTISFKIKTPSTKYHIDILRLGYYQGNGARIIAAGIKPSATAAAEPADLPDRLLDRTDRLRQLGGVGVVDGAEHRGVRRLHRPSRP